MAWTPLPTNYKNMAWNGLKKYTQINNEDGTKSFRDDTEYVNKEESFFGAEEANRSNEAMNYIMTKLENGTDLYSEFQSFFQTQRQLFLTNGESIINEAHSKVDVDYASFTAYINTLKQTGNTALSNIESGYETRMNQFELEKQGVFNAWFQSMQDTLSGDVAGNLSARIAVVEGALPSKANASYVDDTFAPLNNPVFTGTPTVPTPTLPKGIATKEYVDNSAAGASKVYVLTIQPFSGTTMISISGVTVNDFPIVDFYYGEETNHYGEYAKLTYVESVAGGIKLHAQPAISSNIKVKVVIIPCKE